MPGILTIDGTDYDADGRSEHSLSVDAYCAWELQRGADAWLEFHEYGAGPQPRFQGRKAVEYRDAGGTLRFKGVTTLAQPGWDEGRTWGYRCVGLKYLMNGLQFTATDFSGSIQFNLPVTDDQSIPSRRGLSVGEIVQAVIDMNAAGLTSIGVSADATTEAQLAAMTRVPVDRVYVYGQLAEAIERLLENYAANVRMVVLPSGLIRFVDAAAMGEAGATAAAHVLTLGTDPIEPPLLRRDWSCCAPRVVVRGQGDVRPFNARWTTPTHELHSAWTSGQAADWKDSDFTHPGDASDVGTVTTTGGPTSVTIQSGDPARTWPANFWNKRQAWIHLKKTTGVGLEYSVAAPVTACDAMTAGGTAEITLGLELENSASDAWDSYELIGATAPLEDDDGDTGLNNVYRLFDVVTPGGFVEDHLVTSSQAEFPFYGLNNSSAVLVSTPVAMLVKDGTAVPATFRVIPETGQILFDEPIVRAFSSQADLQAGGSAVTPPDDILVMLLYSRGALEAAYPPDVAGVPQYEGTSHAWAGLTNTRVEDVESWSYAGNAGLMRALAKDIHKSIKDVQVEGSATYLGLYEDVLDPGDGHTLSFDAACYETGDEAVALAVRSVVVRINHRGGGPPIVTEMTLSNRVDFLTDPRYTHSMTRLGGGMMFPQLQSPFGAGLPTYGGGTEAGGGFDASAAFASPDEFGTVDWKTGKDVRQSGGRGFKAREADKAARRQQAEDARHDFTREARRQAQDEQGAREARAADGPLPFGEVVPDRDSRDRAEALERSRQESERRRALGRSRPDTDDF